MAESLLALCLSQRNARSAFPKGRHRLLCLPHCQRKGAPLWAVRSKGWTVKGQGRVQESREMGQQAKCLHTVERVPNSSGSLICPDCRKDWRSRDYRKHYIHHMWTQVRIRAEHRGISFDLTEVDIIIPKVCPVLGIELEVGIGGQTDASPSLDRLIPSLGYTRGNIAVISNRANRLKSDGTAAEHEAIVRWMRSLGV